MTAATLDEAIDAAERGRLRADGRHPLARSRRGRRAGSTRVQAGNLYVNRPITGAIVRRQPFGGWKRSAVGPGAKAGGPNTLFVLGSWQPVPRARERRPAPRRLDARVARVIEACQPALDYVEFDAVRRGVPQRRRGLGARVRRSSRDVSDLGRRAQRVPLPPDRRSRCGWPRAASLAELVRVLAAGVLARASLRVSSAVPLPAGLLPLIDAADLRRRCRCSASSRSTVESDAAFARPRGAPSCPAGASGRRRVARRAPTSPSASAAARTSRSGRDRSPSAGRIELLPFLREQAVSITAHRFGNPDRAMIGLTLVARPRHVSNDALRSRRRYLSKRAPRRVRREQDEDEQDDAADEGDQADEVEAPAAVGVVQTAPRRARLSGRGSRGPRWPTARCRIPYPRAETRGTACTWVGRRSRPPGCR